MRRARPSTMAPLLLMALVLTQTVLFKVATGQPGFGGAAPGQVGTPITGAVGPQAGGNGLTTASSIAAEAERPAIETASMFSARPAATLPTIEQFIASLGTGTNLQSIEQALALLPYQDALRLQSYLITIGTLELGAFNAIPVALIGLVSVGLGIGASVMVTIGGALYTAASSTSLYATLSGILAGRLQQCKAGLDGAGSGGLESGGIPEFATSTESGTTSARFGSSTNTTTGDLKYINDKNLKADKNKKDEDYGLPKLNETYVLVDAEKKKEQDEKLAEKKEKLDAKDAERCRKLNLKYPTEGSGVEYLLDEMMDEDSQFYGLGPMVEQAYDVGRYTMPYLFSDAPGSLNDDLAGAEEALLQTLKQIDMYTPKARMGHQDGKDDSGREKDVTEKGDRRQDSRARSKATDRNKD